MQTEKGGLKGGVVFFFKEKKDKEKKNNILYFCLAIPACQSIAQIGRITTPAAPVLLRAAAQPSEPAGGVKSLEI